MRDRSEVLGLLPHPCFVVDMKHRVVTIGVKPQVFCHPAGYLGRKIRGAGNDTVHPYGTALRQHRLFVRQRDGIEIVSYLTRHLIAVFIGKAMRLNAHLPSLEVQRHLPFTGAHDGYFAFRIH